MSTGSIIENNRMQAVLLPFETRFPSNVKNVMVCVRGNERILTPTGCEWGSFFNATAGVTDDFIAERGPKLQPEREPF